jgi:hypothetical protein
MLHNPKNTDFYECTLLYVNGNFCNKETHMCATQSNWRTLNGSEQTTSTPKTVHAELIKTRRVFISFALYSNNRFELAEIQYSPGYNDIALYDTSSIASDILWHQLIRHC